VLRQKLKWAGGKYYDLRRHVLKARDTGYGERGHALQKERFAHTAAAAPITAEASHHKLQASALR
jgi:hypothetical protein